MLQPKDKTGWMDTKANPYICCLKETHIKPRDTYRLKVKWQKKILNAYGDHKKERVAILISDKINIEIKTVIRDKEGHLIMIKGTIQEKDIKILNIYAPSIVKEVTLLCLPLCNPMDCSLPGSSIHGIFQARVLEWLAISFSRGSSQPRDQIYISCISRRILYHWATPETPLGMGTTAKVDLKTMRTSTYWALWQPSTALSVDHGTSKHPPAQSSWHVKVRTLLEQDCKEGFGRGNWRQPKGEGWSSQGHGWGSWDALWWELSPPSPQHLLLHKYICYFLPLLTRWPLIRVKPKGFKLKLQLDYKATFCHLNRNTFWFWHAIL